MGSNELVVIDNSKDEGEEGRVTKVKNPQELWEAVWKKVYDRGLGSFDIYEAE
jgi:hypothetical protein